ncbi:MAG: hypothetical protein EP343_00545 [Deltaproteobacteria bacterium]|nr:MAG: hypothetical protein EP343_00545 [Deltaproteobacteria bacterium]
MASAKSQTQRNLMYGAVTLLATGLLVVFVLHPGYLLLTLPKFQASPKAIMPAKPMLKRLETYHRILSAGPVFRPYVRKRAATLLSQHIHPTRIERSFRRLLMGKSLQDWFKRIRTWDTLLRRLEKQYPSLHLDAYRAYLYLQAGQLQRLRKWGEELPEEAPRHRLTLLRRVWIGHACFLGGWTNEAFRHYKLALQGYEANPSWDSRTPSNWRLPAELTSVLYHLSLIQMKNKQYADAYKHLQRMKQRLLVIRPKAHRMPLWLLIHTWSAIACQRRGEWKRARHHHKQAQRYSDPTLSLLTEPSQPVSNNGALRKVIATHRPHKHSYPDSPNLARLALATSLFQQKQPREAYVLVSQVLRDLQNRTLSPTLSMLQRKDTYKVRFLPAPPSLWRELAQVIQRAPFPQTTKRAATSQPTSKPKAPTKKPLSASSRREAKAWILRKVRFYQALSHLKLFQWKTAASLLQSLVKEAPKEPTPLLYLGILALQNQQDLQAYRLFKRYHQAKSGKISALYLAYAAVRVKAPEASSWLNKLSQVGVRKSVIARIQALYQRKPMPTKTRQVQYWWRVLGVQGLLTIFDPHLRRRSHYWRVRPNLQSQTLPKEMLRSLWVSHHVSRFSLNTWLGRYRYLAEFFPKKRKEYLRRMRYIRSYYLAFPEMWYALDRVMYTKQWGLLAMGLY